MDCDSPRSCHVGRDRFDHLLAVRRPTVIQTFTCKIRYGEHSWRDWPDEDWMPARAHCERKWEVGYYFVSATFFPNYPDEEEELILFQRQQDHNGKPDAGLSIG